MPRVTGAPSERFASKWILDPVTGCWNWTDRLNAKGYGSFWTGESETRAHRWAYANTYGAIPGDLVIDHLCRNRRCVNPAHLEAVTVAENNRRQEQFNSKKTHCKRGHRLADENLYLKTGPQGRAWRMCRDCARSQQRERRALRAEEEKG